MSPGADISAISLESSEVNKGRLLLSMERAFDGHTVPNSMVHTMTTLDRLFHFYSTRVDMRTPYEKLHDDQGRGRLPPNLHVQRYAKRFDPDDDGDSEFDRITAFPTSSTIIVDPENRKKYRDRAAARPPWTNSQKDVQEHKDGFSGKARDGTV